MPKGQHWNLGQASRQTNKKKKQEETKNKRRERKKKRKGVCRAFDRQRQGYNIVTAPTIPLTQAERKKERKKER